MLDGFIITAGQANGSYSDGSGGGMSNYSGNVTLNNVTFSANLAYYGGGGMLNDGKPTLTNVVFLENSADKQGGGMCNEGFSQPVLTNVSFSGNTAAEGGGICIYQGSNPILKNVTFSANSATFGGGMMISNSGYTSAAISLLNSSFFDTVA